MFVMITGGGRTGATLALTLYAQKHEVRLIEHRRRCSPTSTASCRPR